MKEVTAVHVEKLWDVCQDVLEDRVLGTTLTALDAMDEAEKTAAEKFKALVRVLAVHV